MNGLDLFSGIGGISIALRDYVNVCAYCEIDRYCQAVLLSRMYDGKIPRAAIWDDIKTLEGRNLPSIDIIYGGFPCQDISCAGLGKGLSGERSGLFYHLIRLCSEIKPRFIFLENVPAITTRGGTEVVREIAALGYDCKWCVISAASLGAPHKRERWFLLAHANCCSSRGKLRNVSSQDEKIIESEEHRQKKASKSSDGCKNDANSSSERLQGFRERASCTEKEKPVPSCISENVTHTESNRMRKIGEAEREQKRQSEPLVQSLSSYWSETQPPLCGVDDGFPYRAQRIKCMGNAVVPDQAKEAFKILMGLK